MQKNLRQKIFIALGVVIFNLNLAIAGVPEDGTIIIFAAESEVNFNVSGCEPSMISKVIYFKVDASAELHEISASYCEADVCKYSITKVGLETGIYQIQVYIEGYSEPITKSFVL